MALVGDVIRELGDVAALVKVRSGIALRKVLIGSVAAKITGLTEFGAASEKPDIAGCTKPDIAGCTASESVC